MLKDTVKKETAKFERAAQKAAEKKAALAAEALNLEAQLKTPILYGTNEDVFNIGSGRRGLFREIREQLEGIEERRKYPLVYDDEYRAAFINYLEAIRGEVVEEYNELVAEYNQARAEKDAELIILNARCNNARQRLIDFECEYNAIVWAIHDKAEESSERPISPLDRRKDPIKLGFNPVSNIDYNLEQLELISEQKELEKDPEYWKRKTEEVAAQREGEKNSGLKRNSFYREI